MFRARLALIFLVPGVMCILEPGIWKAPYDSEHTIYAFHKSMLQGTKISVKIDCHDKDTKLQIDWVLRYSPCAEEYNGVESNILQQRNYLMLPQAQLFKEFTYPKMEFIHSNNTNVYDECQNGVFWLFGYMQTKPTITKSEVYGNTTEQKEETTTKPSKVKRELKIPGMKKAVKAGKSNGTTTTLTPSTTTASTKKSTRTTQAVISTTTTGKPTGTTGTKKPSLLPGSQVDNTNLVQAWKDGYYVFVLQIQDMSKKPSKEAIMVTVGMKGKYGYISAVEWPLLIFYGVMGIVYIIFSLVWLVMLACSWRDLLRVQFWIGAVILLGMLEKAVFYAEHQSITTTGNSVRGAVIFAELISCCKRALARILVVIVSLGFGIVKPRLGTTFHKVVGVGILYFVVASIEGCMRQLKPTGDQSSDVLLAEIPLAVIDASLCWWIFSSLIQTTRTLRLRRNLVKLSLYRHFTNTLIFAVLASIAFMIWSFTQHKMKTCITDWRELWVDEAFWHLLFSVILCVIMVLWRPSANNQRYAFSPLLDAADEEEEESLMNDAFDGMKLRGVKGSANGSPKGRNSVEDDLKWVEENIPTSITDKALPSLLDSDEEMMTTRYEVNKMQ